ncbi:Serpentine type 7TM GPCR chemoreceptor Srw [Parelaphostrongylus tenuis]|uniref:Serpentine type 7TM GPCR chemoreceptor Srw n=1 Tax=Parelaphostrongylus tenuis TaxID=148309 RepID=A0AAD5ML78_PARTN|nr:Serpentine type 7TM GPCR chemoreceptor Srw [Parelaphostrongylus tenuis]
MSDSLKPMEMCEMGSIPLKDATWIADAVGTLHNGYAHIHPYIAVILCLAGTAMNAVTVVVFTRPSMLSPINAILCAVAICDILVMTSVLVFVYHFLISSAFRCDVEDYNRLWAYFLFAHSQCTVILHATSIWLTVLLAQIRVYTIKRATSGPTEAITAKATGFIALVTLFIVALVNIPNFMTFEIVEIDAELWLPCLISASEDAPLQTTSTILESGFNSTETPSFGKIFHVRASDEDCFLLKVAFWVNGLFFKVVPCALLTVSIIALLKIIRDVSQRRKSLALVMNKKRMPRDHTTPMLVAVLSIFLIAELPQGMLHVCNAIFSNETFYKTIYLPLGDLMDLLSLINSAVNFLIYCAMSRKFRNVFMQTFMACLPDPLYRKLLRDWPALGDLEVTRTKPSGVTDLTKSEQLALTSSHRVSTTSTLIQMNPKESTSKMYTNNLLSVADPLNRTRVSLGVHGSGSIARNSLEIHEICLVVPDRNSNKRQLNFFPNPIKAIRQLWESSTQTIQSSPQRRINLIHCETQY